MKTTKDNSEAEKKINEMLTLLQEHADCFEGGHEAIVDFVVVTAALDEEGQWRYSYLTSPMITPHSAKGLIEMGQEQMGEDLFPTRDEE